MQTDPPQHDLPVLPLKAADILAALQKHQQRILLYGPMGIGKSTLSMQLAETLATQQKPCCCINADPGSPAFGVPGTVSLANWENGDWQVSKYAALCTLDAGRFRLPLVAAVQSLVSNLPDSMILIDAPGVVRGVAGKELLGALVEATGANAVLALTARDQLPPLLDELRALSVAVYVVDTATEAMRPSKRARARQRTGQWDTYLGERVEQQILLTNINIIGTPPPLSEAHAWLGKQVALLQANHTLALGEVQQLTHNSLTITLPFEVPQADTLLVRDAMRNPDGLIETAMLYAKERYDYLPPGDVIPAVGVDTGPRLVGRVGAVDVGLINGVFGDPLLHVRMRHQRRSLLFDLGDGSRLPARIAHQVTDIFISHAHLDHIGGFLWLLRSRLGDYPNCRLYGPPGLGQHIHGFLQGILWDRIADNGPGFDVLELHGNHLKHFCLQAGYHETQYLGEEEIINHVLLREAGFQVSGITLDHKGTSVMAYALQPDKQINVRKDRLQSRGLAPGPWLNDLKQQLLMDNDDAILQLPDGSKASASALADELVIITPGKKIVYATDLADSRENRRQLIEMAQQAHTLFCEAAFIEADVDHAMRNGHLTTRACGEIANQAAVSRLVPFHFSRRYADNPQLLYNEIQNYCQCVLVPTPTAPVEITEEVFN